MVVRKPGDCDCVHDGFGGIVGNELYVYFDDY